ncbi:3-oxoadipate enol-lactonase [Pelagibius litoralis]|uniref:3-oxoadipate enol-lactonase n=1 Tax=Pelagibius litoralis TaxID=374515 RepID=A0A967EZ29_9PROT|nr:3-oxoadipate enol-lactonase [Pelagibius litoralis]NIA69995.1 3-oxoadipate enol-lactonase [Pelagibius litoralis]
MHFMAVNGLTLHVSDSGMTERPALVFSNSLGTDFRIWDQVVARLGERFRILRYDKRGHGLSDIGVSPYAMTDHVEDLAALMDSLSIDKAVICGLSVGGLIAQGLYASRPDLVRGLILCDTAHKIGNDALWNSRIATVETEGIAAIAEGVMERWFTKALREGDPVALAGWRNMLTRTPAAGYAGTSAAIRDTDFTDQTPAIAVPTLCMVGEEDGATPPALMQELTALIPGARCEVIAGAGHLPCIEQPQVVAELILTFTREAGLV